MQGPVYWKTGVQYFEKISPFNFVCYFDEVVHDY